MPEFDAIAVLDFGSQYSQLIARRVREAQVYCELFPWNAPAESVLALRPKGFILSGGPASVYAPGAPQVPGYVLQSGRPARMRYGCRTVTASSACRMAFARWRPAWAARRRRWATRRAAGTGCSS